MDTIFESSNFIDSKDLPIEYVILKLRISFNKDLLEKKVISYDIYSKMQQLLMKKIDKIILDSNTNI